MNNHAQERTPLLVTADEAAAALAVSRSTLYALVRAGVLHPVKIGRATRFRWSELEQVAASGNLCFEVAA